MTSKNLKSAIWLTLAVGATALAAGGPPPGKGGGGGETTAAQNLSVPTILVGPLGTLVCGASDAAPSVLKAPTGTPLTGYEVPGYYWVQKVHVWQAQCFNASTALVYGAWGDNLEGGDASLKVGSPIRVELVLENRTEYASPTTLQGYTVIKLETSKLDRLSAYGHQAGGDATAGWTNIPTDFGQAQWLVHNQGITFSVLNTDKNVYAVQPGTNPTAEINATGKVVYGYNLRVEAAGNYRIQFTSTPAVTFTGSDAGGVLDANNVYIDVVVAPGGGKKGGGRL
jgi:hypothetical protein